VAEEPLRLAQNIPGDSKPVILYADEITTWTEGAQRLILLKGRVLIEQGVVQTHMQMGVVWLDQERARRSGILHVDVYAEGDVVLENGPTSRSGSKAILELNTRGELKLKSQLSKVIQEPRPQDPLYRRGMAERFPTVAQPPAQPIHRVSGYDQDPEAPRSLPSQLPPPGTDRTPAIVPPPVPPPGSPPPPSVPPAGPPAMPRSPSEDLPPVVPPPPSPPPSAPAVPGPSGQTVPPAGPNAPRPGTAPGPPQARPTIQPAQRQVRRIRIVGRTSAFFQEQTRQLPNGEQALFVTGGVIVTVSDLDGKGLVDIEGDRLLVWTKGSFQDMAARIRGDKGHTTKEAEFYLAGNVIIREKSGDQNRTLRADEIYYDVGRSVAVARNAELEFKQPGMPDPMHFHAEELYQLSQHQFQGERAEIFSSRLPSDPGLKIYVAEGTLDEKRIPKKSIFGKQVYNRKTGEPESEPQRIFHGENAFLELENVPIFYSPFIQGDANDPFGPLQNIVFRNDRIFGTQFYTTFNMYNLLGLDPVPGTRWRLYLDYLSRRGPAAGTDYEYGGHDLFDLPGKYVGLVKLFGVNDDATDKLGGFRDDNPEHHPMNRGRFLFRHSQELPDDFTVQTQISVLSDKNFLEEYYKDEFDRDINQETFLYVKQQRDNWAWTGLVEPRIRDWVTQTEWLPRADGYLLGQNLLDYFTYNVHASAGFARLDITHLPPPPVEITQQPDTTGRFDINQELSLPFLLGPFRLVPYVTLDLTYYTEDLTGTDRGRVYEGGGVRGSMPLSRLYPDVESEYLNLSGLYHKIVLSANAFFAHSDTPYTRLPQLDAINDDATDQMLRDIKPKEPDVNPRYGQMLATSPVYDPQLFAIRRLVEDKIDTLDSIEEVQMDIRQRLQTKRGYPGMEHITNWMTLDMSASYFPDPNRDNFGHDFAFLQYDYSWYVGDRTALVSSGWTDPYPGGPKVWTIGSYFNRPDRTEVYLGYREIYPLQSRAVSAGVTYVFSPKYKLNASTTYDFGTGQSLDNSLVFTRIGSDLQIGIGINYNAITNNFGVTFEVYPNVIPESRRGVAFGSSMVGSH
jgi:hypothetical protein